VLVAVGTGATTLIVWMGPSAYVDYRVTVLKTTAPATARSGRSASSSRPGGGDRADGGRAGLHRRFTYTAADTDRVAKIAACYPALVVNLVSPRPVSRTLLAGRNTGDS
jgi:hypothetical protein